MKPIETARLAAVCGHTQTGSSKVFANGLGVTRVGVDTAGGKIAGPGSSTVFVEGSKVSIVGDTVESHSPCPDEPIHCTPPTNKKGQPSVMVGA